MATNKPSNVTSITAATQSSTKVTLDSVVQEIIGWRSNKQSRSEQMPEEIWDLIFELSEKFPTSTICAAAGVNTTQFRRKLDERMAYSNSHNKIDPLEDLDFCEVATGKLTADPSMYKPEKIPATNTLIVEFCRADGQIMKIHTTTDSFAELMQAFFSGK